MSVKIYQVSVTTEYASTSSLTLGTVGSTRGTWYDPTVKAFSSKEKAEEYISDLRACYEKLNNASGRKLVNMKFELREVEVD